MTNAKLKVVPKPAPEPWERQPGEGPRAFQHFRAYLDLGPGRTLAKLGQNLGLSTTTLEQHSRDHNWVQRVAAWDDEALRRQDQTELDEIEKRTRRHAQVSAVSIEALSLTSQELLRRLSDNRELLRALPLDQLLSRIAIDARALARVVVTERLVRGVSTENVGGHDGGPIGAFRERVQRMTPEELDEFLLGQGVAILADERKKKAGKGGAK